MSNFFKKILAKKSPEQQSATPQAIQEEPEQPISKRLDETIASVKSELGSPSDLFINVSQTDEGLRYACLYIDNLVERGTINHLSEELTTILKSQEKFTKHNREGCYHAIKNCLSGFCKSNEGTDINQLCKDLLLGSSIFLVDGCARFLSINTFGAEGRSVGEPTSQTVVRGPKEAFTERIGINISMIRRKIRSKTLRVEELVLGTVTHTPISLMYLHGIAKAELVAEVKRRLNLIKIDGILDSAYIEELIKDKRYSFFPTFLSSEKPDAVAGALLEGRVAILVDGSGYVLTAPGLFLEFFQTTEDYYHQFFISSLIRFGRTTAFAITLFLPSIYTSLITFHQEMIPTPLLISIAAQREGLPFPAFVEALIMGGAFEIIMEAGIRMPRAIGPAITFAGALILGQTAVEAGLISPAMVIVSALTAITAFAIPNYEMLNPLRILRLFLLFLGGVFGLYGLFMGVIIIVLHLCSIKSFGVPYLTPVAPLAKEGLKDFMVRFPLWLYQTRPAGIGAANVSRVDMAQSPVNEAQTEKPEFR